MKQSFKIFSLLTLMVVAETAISAQGVSIGFGQGNEDIAATRFSAIWDWKTQWNLYKQLSVSGYWEASLSRWNGDPSEPNSNDKMTLIAAAPVFVLQYQTHYLTPYIQAGIGASLLSETEIGDRELSTNFQFEDRLGAGIKFGPQQKLDLNLTAFHHSNAGIKRPNNGVNLVLVNLIYRF